MVSPTDTLAAFPTLTSITGIISAVGALGVAAYGLVDASKAFLGGVSTRGFANIAMVMATLIPDVPVSEATSVSTEEPPAPPALSLASMLTSLKSNWLNGMNSADQREIAKTLVKLHLNAATAKPLGVVTGVDPVLLAQVAVKMSSGLPLLPLETDVYGRFDLVLTTILDQAFQRADQQYRNTAKAAAVLVSIVLSIVGASCIGLSVSPMHRTFWQALLLGLLATPLAPIAKDLSSAVQAGAKAAQAWTTGK